MLTAAKKRPEDQTTDEWLAEYGGTSHASADGMRPPKHPPGANSSANETTHLFRFIGHRTTRTGSVVLEFETLDGQLQAVKFFNVSIKSRRGNTYPAGIHGQFDPPERGKFRRFWMEAVGQPPGRWCRVHKSLRSKLGKLVFTGEIKHCIDRKGIGYNKITNLTCVQEGELAQLSHKLGTI
ncbi:hypothetical protein [Thiohalophilus thiocyanatoxydans]|uniref:Uncharacterized protein n=1 Tax=Thiohalophilus thiocyanatoxydans TaxID=381308 RepID=A0A4R8INH2_9GAMM|nr:hypothetical protein [Thiohalophilus thiocyanatoxydans]TDY02422.1 hypothetical protein EDC23_0791 [Thiohalophilus thiocyanatoxydans]